MFITFNALTHLGKPEAPWETPFGMVTDGMESVVDKLYTGYRDQQPFNPNGVNQGKLANEGNDYLRCDFGAPCYRVHSYLGYTAHNEPVPVAW